MKKRDIYKRRKENREKERFSFLLISIVRDRELRD
jgi:hypothetical protein